MTDSDKEIHLLEIDVPVDKIGSFIGKSGRFIKNHVVIETKKKLFDTSEKKDDESEEDRKIRWKQTHIFCHVFEENGVVKAKLEAKNATHMDTIKECLEAYVSLFREKQETASKVVLGRQKYTFKVKVDSSVIGKIIGVEASNIKKLNEVLIEKLKLSKSPYIRIYKEGSENCPTLTVPDMTGTGIWLHISYYGTKQYVIVDDCVRGFLNDTFSEKRESIVPSDLCDDW